MTIKEIADRAGLKYHTARNYLKLFEEHGIEPTEAVIPLIKKIPSLLSEGLTTSEAVNFLLRTPEKEEGQTFSEVLLRLERKIDHLEKENRAQSDLLQVYLSKIDRLEETIRALPAPKEKKSFVKSVADFFKKKNGI